MTVKRLQNAYLVVDDMARAEGFYRAVLDVQDKFRDGQRWLQFTTGVANLALACPEEAPAGFRGTMLVFEVDDLDAARARIEAAGGTVTGLRDMGTHGRVLSLLDTEGNPLQLFARSA